MKFFRSNQKVGDSYRQPLIFWVVKTRKQFMDWACDRKEATRTSYIPLILMEKSHENTHLEDQKGDGRIRLT
jgi:hypothetical protein